MRMHAVVDFPAARFQLSLTLFSIIGGFWLLDSLKDTVLEGTVGMEFQPRAKLVSVAVTLLLVIQYNRLVDSCSKPTVSISGESLKLSVLPST